MRVENQGAAGAGSFPLTVDDRRYSWIRCLEQTRREFASLHHGHDSGSIATNIFAITRDIWYGEQIHELAEDFVLVRPAIISHRTGAERGCMGEQQGEEQGWQVFD